MPRQEEDPDVQDPRRIGLIGGAIALVLITLSVVVLALEARYRSCIEAAEAKYPAVAVSAFNTRSTGPVKVSFVQQRQDAVENCGRL